MSEQAPNIETSVQDRARKIAGRATEFRVEVIRNEVSGNRASSQGSGEVIVAGTALPESSNRAPEAALETGGFQKGDNVLIQRRAKDGKGAYYQPAKFEGVIGEGDKKAVVSWEEAGETLHKKMSMDGFVLLQERYRNGEISPKQEKVAESNERLPKDDFNESMVNLRNVLRDPVSGEFLEVDNSGGKYDDLIELSRNYDFLPGTRKAEVQDKIAVIKKDIASKRRSFTDAQVFSKDELRGIVDAAKEDEVTVDTLPSKLEHRLGYFGDDAETWRNRLLDYQKADERRKRFLDSGLTPEELKDWNSLKKDLR